MSFISSNFSLSLRVTSPPNFAHACALRDYSLSSSDVASL